MSTEDTPEGLGFLLQSLEKKERDKRIESLLEFVSMALSKRDYCEGHLNALLHDESGYAFRDALLSEIRVAFPELVCAKVTEL